MPSLTQCVDRTLTDASSNQQGALELRLGITFIHRPLLNVVIFIFIFRILERIREQVSRDPRTRSDQRLNWITESHSLMSRCPKSSGRLLISNDRLDALYHQVDVTAGGLLLLLHSMAQLSGKPRRKTPFSPRASWTESSDLHHSINFPVSSYWPMAAQRVADAPTWTKRPFWLMNFLWTRCEHMNGAPAELN